MSYKLRWTDEKFDEAFRLLNAFYGNWPWKTIHARKDHNDEFGDVIETGEEYFSRDIGIAWGDNLKLSIRSMDVLLTIFLCDNAFGNSVGTLLAQQQDLELHKKLREAAEKLGAAYSRTTGGPAET